MTSKRVFLTKTLYLPEKRQIVAEFSGERKKISKRFSFFPFFFMPNNPQFIREIKNFDSKKLKIDEINQTTVRVIGATFNDLKKAADLLRKNFNKEVMLLPTQKQFLIERGWSYFDSFTSEKEDLLKDETIHPPDVFLEILQSSTKNVFFDLKKSSELSAKKFIEKICISNILKTNILELPETTEKFADLFLENLFFKHRFPFLIDVKQFFQNKETALNEKVDGFVKINFLSVLKTISSFSFYNIGFDSVNCSCCKNNISETKVSPGSLIKTEFLVDGTYFEPSLKSWSKKFHESNDKKLQRISFQKEWGLKDLPAGPFFARDKAVITLADHKFLNKKNLVKKEFDFVKKIWFCQKKESFLSIELGENHKTVKLIKKSSSKLHSAKIVSAGILFYQILSQDFSYAYFESLSKQLEKLSSSVFFLMLNPSSRFFDRNLADSIECIQSAVLKNFSDFAEKNGSNGTKLRQFDVFVKSKNPFFLAKQFAAAFNLPSPDITL